MRVLMVDDELHRMAPWKMAIEALEGVHVDVRSRADDAMRYIEGCTDLGLILVYDLMMPTPAQHTGRETEFGTRTGRLVHAAFRRRFPNNPAYLLSGATDAEAFAELTAGPNDHLCQKELVLPRELAERVRRRV